MVYKVPDGIWHVKIYPGGGVSWSNSLFPNAVDAATTAYGWHGVDYFRNNTNFWGQPRDAYTGTWELLFNAIR